MPSPNLSSIANAQKLYGFIEVAIYPDLRLKVEYLKGEVAILFFSNTIWVFDCIRQNADKSFVRGLVACMWKVGSDRCPVSFPVCAPPPLEAGEGGRGEGWHEQRKREFFGLAFGNILAFDKDFSGFDGYQYCLLGHVCRGAAKSLSIAPADFSFQICFFHIFKI